MELGSIFSGFDVSVIIDKIYYFVGFFLLVAFLGGIGMTVWYLGKKKKSLQNSAKIGWWEEVSGTKRLEPGQMEEVEEIIIPGTTLRVFYGKKREIWLPRFSRGVSKNLFYVCLTAKQDMVNFTLKSLSEDLKSADLEFDHTDMLWAAENTREFIKRNYRDKSVKWWQAYQGVITTAIYLLVMTFSFVLIIYFMRGMVQDLSGVASAMSEAAKLCNAPATSGIVAA